MSHRLVRCPYCGKRFNVAGINAGSRLRCGGCTAILTVPRVDVPPPRAYSRSMFLQVGGSLAAGLAAAAALYFALKPPAATPEAAPVLAQAPAAVPGPAGAPVPPAERPAGPIVTDPMAQAKGRILQDFRSTQFVWFEGAPPYLVAVERSDRYLAKDRWEDTRQRLELLYAAFRREFGSRLDLPEVEPALAVVVLSSRESFDRYCEARDGRKMPASIKGLYEYRQRRIVAYHDVSVPYEVMLHEGVHQLVHYHTMRETEREKTPSAYWFQEGLATYFEGYRRRPDGSIENDVPARGARLAILKQALQEPGHKDFISLQMLVGMTVDEFWDWFEKMQVHSPSDASRKANLYYAESWALVHFLRHGDGNLEKLFDEYFREELGGRGSKESFERLLHRHVGKELSQLEGEFVAYIYNLR